MAQSTNPRVELSREDLSPEKSIDAVFKEQQAVGIDRNAAHVFAFASAAWLATIAAPLLFFPRFLALFLGPPLTADDQEGAVLRQLNGLERYLAQLTGSVFIAFALILVVQTGSIPLFSSFASSPSHHNPAHSAGPQASAAPFRSPTVLITTFLFTALGTISYTTGLTVFSVIQGLFSLWGVWVFLFASKNPAKTDAGNDKHQSSFPFKNDRAHERKVE